MLTINMQNVLYDKDSRFFLMGCGMFMVILYHLFCFDKSTSLWSIFYPGYLGVDVFLFLSGYGLCFSFRNNPLGIFYKRRLLRILPLYWVMVSLCLLILFFLKAPFSWKDGLFCYLTLSFWNVGNVFIEWYLCALLLLYILFPLFFVICRRVNDGLLLFLSLIAVIVFASMTNFEWQFYCAFSRIPIFLLGIMCFSDKNFFTKKGLPIYTLFLIFGIGLYAMNVIPTYIMVYMSAPYVIALAAIIYCFAKHSCPMVVRLLSDLGTITLEVYVANVITLLTADLFSDIKYSSIVYFVLTILLSYLMVKLNRKVGSFSQQNER